MLCRHSGPFRINELLHLISLFLLLLLFFLHFYRLSSYQTVTAVRISIVSLEVRGCFFKFRYFVDLKRFLF